MSTVRQYVSDVVNEGKLYSIDDFLSPRFCHVKIKKIIADFIAKDNNSNRLLGKNVEIWKEIAIPMIEVDIQNFSELTYGNCQKLMRSKYKLPAIYSSKYGAIIKQVTSLNVGKDYDTLMSMRIWKAAQTQEYKSKKYGVFISGYYYIPIPIGEQSSPQEVRMEAFFIDHFEVQKYNELIGKTPKSCASAVDYELPIPFYLQDDVNKEVFKQLSQIYFKLTPDALPNLNPTERTNPTTL